MLFKNLLIMLNIFFFVYCGSRFLEGEGVVNLIVALTNALGAILLSLTNKKE